jgi:transcriptional regulator with XRE-family HTH domain
VSFAANLQRLREEAGLSQTELARQAGLSIDSLRNWEQAKALPRIDAVVKLAAALSVPVDALVQGIDAGPSQRPLAKKKKRRK